MKALLTLAIALPLLGQQAASTSDASPSDTSSPVPTSEPRLSGWIDLGYRWRTDVGGSFDTYRSIVNLGSGPKLVGAEVTLTDPASRAYDKIHLRAYSWGDEPSQSFHAD